MTAAKYKRKPVRIAQQGQIPALLGTKDTLIAWHMFRHGWRTDEIATALTVTEAEVANSLHRLREMIRGGYKSRVIYLRQSPSGSPQPVSEGRDSAQSLRAASLAPHSGEANG